MQSKLKAMFKDIVEAAGSKVLVGLAMALIAALAGLALMAEKSMVNNAVAATPVMAKTIASIEAVKTQAAANADTAQKAVAEVKVQAETANKKVDQVIATQELQKASTARIFEILTKQGAAMQESSKTMAVGFATISEHMAGMEKALARVQDNQDRGK